MQHNAIKNRAFHKVNPAQFSIEILLGVKVSMGAFLDATQTLPVYSRVLAEHFSFNLRLKAIQTLHQIFL